MTLPDERYRALTQGKKLLEDLCDPGRSPRVPKIIRDRALAVLRHYPSEYEFNQLAQRCPELIDSKPFSIYNSITHKE